MLKQKALRQEHNRVPNSIYENGFLRRKGERRARGWRMAEIISSAATMHNSASGDSRPGTTSTWQALCLGDAA